MGPPLRSFAADAYDCIMVRVLGPTGYKVVARLMRARKAGSPLIVIPIAPSVPSCSKLSRYGLASSEHAASLARRPTLTAPARDDLSEPRVGTKKRALRSNKETDEGKRFAAPANSLTKKAPYKETAGGVARSCVRRYGDFDAGGLLPRCVGSFFGRRSMAGERSRVGRLRDAGSELRGGGRTTRQLS